MLFDGPSPSTWPDLVALSINVFTIRTLTRIQIYKQTQFMTWLGLFLSSRPFFENTTALRRHQCGWSKLLHRFGWCWLIRLSAPQTVIWFMSWVLLLLLVHVGLFVKVNGVHLRDAAQQEQDTRKHVPPLSVVFRLSSLRSLNFSSGLLGASAAILCTRVLW